MRAPYRRVPPLTFHLKWRHLETGQYFVTPQVLTYHEAREAIENARTTRPGWRAWAEAAIA